MKSWGRSGSRTLLIPNFDTSWRSVTKSRSGPFIPRKHPQYVMDRSLRRLEGRSGVSNCIWGLSLSKFWCLVDNPVLKMEAVHVSETSTPFYQATQHFDIFACWPAQLSRHLAIKRETCRPLWLRHVTALRCVGGVCVCVCVCACARSELRKVFPICFDLPWRVGLQDSNIR